MASLLRAAAAAAAAAARRAAAGPIRQPEPMLLLRALCYSAVPAELQPPPPPPAAPLPGTPRLSFAVHGPGDLRLEHRPVPHITANQALVAVAVCGICGSDVHYAKAGRLGPYVVEAPMILGHEAAGTVVQVGAAVGHLRPGDRVAVEPGVPCMACAACLGGRYNLCPLVEFSATPPICGALTEFLAHDARFLHKLPDNVTLEEGALMEPLSVGMHAVRRTGIEEGDTVLITGAGSIGVACLLMAKLAGAGHVVVTDVSAEKAARAHAFGADASVMVLPGEPDEEVVRRIREAAPGPIARAIECTGVAACARQAVSAVAAGGVVGVVGMGSDSVCLPLAHMTLLEVDVRGVFRYANTYPRLLSVLSNRGLPAAAMVTHRFPLREAARAFDTAAGGSALKVVIHVAGQEQGCGSDRATWGGPARG